MYRSPLPPVLEVPHVEGYPILSDPYMFRETMETPGSNYSTLQPHYSYLSFAPPEVIEQLLRWYACTRTNTFTYKHFSYAHHKI